MRKYLLPETGSFYKANLHCHTVLSDGNKTPEEVKEAYQKLGYSIVAYTDHELLIPHDELTDENFLALHGFELEINEENKEWKHLKVCHICFIGIEPENITQPCWHRSKYFFRGNPRHREKVKIDENEPDFERHYSPECITKAMQIGRDKGFFVTYNHPTWNKESYPQYMNYHGMHAMEMFNGGTIVFGYEEYNPRVYEDMLNGGEKIYCIGADDNHNFVPDDDPKTDLATAFTMIKAERLEYRAVTQALEQGHFYASQGPEIHELWYDEGKVYIRTSEAERIILTCQTRRAGSYTGTPEKPVTEGFFEVGPDDGYFRLTVTDKNGKIACTNAYFLEDLM